MSYLTGTPTIPTGFNLPNGSVPANSAADYLASIGGEGGGGGFLSNAFATNVGPKFLGGTGEIGLMRAGIPAALGQAAAWGINQFPATPGTGGATVRETLADAAAGAGLGATVGSILPGIGTGIGAGVGTVLGGGYGLLSNLFGSDNNSSNNDVRTTLAGVATGAGQDPGGYTSKYDLYMKTGMPVTDAKGNVTSVTKDPQQIAAALGQQVYQDRATSLQQKEAAAQQLEMHKADLQNSLAMQSQAAQFFAPYANNIVASGAAQAQMLNSLADQVPAGYKGVFQAQAANALNTSQQTAGAYMGQIAMQPTTQILNNYQQQQQAQQAQMAKIYQYAAQMRQGGAGGTGGAVDFSQLGQQPTTAPGY